MKTAPPVTALPHPLLVAGLGLAAACAPLAWTQVVVEEYTLPKLLCLALGVLVAALGAAASLRRGAAPRRTPLDLPLAAGAAALALSTWFSQDPWQSLLGEYNLRTYGAGTLALCAAMCWLAAAWLGRPGRRRTLRLCVWAGGLVGLYATIQGLGLELFEISAAVLQSGRAVSTIGSPVHLGAFLALLLPVGLHLWRSERGPLPALCLALMASGLWASVSRGAWLAAGLGCALFPLLAGWRPRWGRGAWLALLLAGPAAGLMARKLATRPTRDSDVARVEGWKVAWRIFREHPWLGAGPDTFGPAFRRRKTEAFLRTGSGTILYHADAHNDLLQALSTTGLAGTLAYLALLGALAWAARRALEDPERREEAAALSACLVSLFLVMKLNPASIEVLALAAVLSGLLGAGQDPARSTRASWAWAGLLVLYGAVATAAVGRLCLADRQSQLARGHLARGHAQEVLRHIRRAVALQPAELKYRIIHVNQLMDLVRADRDPERRAAWLAEAEASALEGLRLRPNDVNAPYIAGYVSLIWAQVANRDKLPAAEAHLDAAAPPRSAPGRGAPARGPHRGGPGVGQLDADGGLARDGGDHADALGAHGEGDVVGAGHDRVHGRARGGPGEALRAGRGAAGLERHGLERRGQAAGALGAGPPLAAAHANSPGVVGRRGAPDPGGLGLGLALGGFRGPADGREAAQRRAGPGSDGGRGGGLGRSADQGHGGAGRPGAAARPGARAPAA